MTVADLEEALAACPQEVAARLLGITSRTLRNRIRDGDYPDVGRSRIDVVAALEQERKQTARKATPTADARVRYLTAQAELKELERARNEGRLVSAEEVEELYFETLQIVASGLDGLGARLASKVTGLTDPMAVQALIHDETRRIRDRAAEQLSGEDQVTADLPDPARRRADPAPAARPGA